VGAAVGASGWPVTCRIIWRLGGRRAPVLVACPWPIRCSYRVSSGSQILAFYSLISAGTSRHAALVGAYLLEQLAGIPPAVFHVGRSEFRYAPTPLWPTRSLSGSPIRRNGPTHACFFVLCAAC